MFSVLRFMHVEHSSEQVSYSSMQLNDFVTLCFLLNNGDVSAFLPNGGDGGRNTVGRKAVLSILIDN